MDVDPDFIATSGADLQAVLVTLLTVVLVVAVLMILVSSIAWAVASSHGSHTGAAKAKAGLFVGIAAAALAGAGVARLNFLIRIGANL